VDGPWLVVLRGRVVAALDVDTPPDEVYFPDSEAENLAGAQTRKHTDREDDLHIANQRSVYRPYLLLTSDVRRLSRVVFWAEEALRRAIETSDWIRGELAVHHEPPFGIVAGDSDPSIVLRPRKP
jgi:hypothetical protein